MPYTIVTRDTSLAPHEWVIAVATCNLDDENDHLLKSTVDLIRESYGETAVMADAEVVLADEIEGGFFNLDHLLAAIRQGLPDPNSEGNKPKQLTNYRSQSAEMVAKAALAKAYSYRYPAAPQEGAANPNQPILGFDGWGVLENGAGVLSLALIQVKATDSAKSPPADSEVLASECRKAPIDRQALCRALTVLARLLKGDPLNVSVLKMLESLGRGESISLLISPAVVRGTTSPKPSDIEPVMTIANEILPASIRAVVVSIGVSLDEFGHLVMTKARGVA